MQLAETLLILFVTGNIFYFIFGKKPIKALGLTGLILLVFHILLGEARWQAIPVYLVLSILVWVNFFQPKSRKWLRIMGYSFGIIFIILSSALCFALPVFKLYKPTGPYAISSESLYLKDDAREEDITLKQGDKRELMIDLYYPTNELGKTINYLPEVERKGFALKYGLPSFAFNYLDAVETFIQGKNAPLNDSFPVLIFSPGYYTPASGYQSILADMASHGYIIFSINHSYETMGSRFPDGREIYFDQEFAANSYWSEAMTNAIKRFDAATTEEAKFEAIQHVNEVFDGGGPMIARWAADITSVIDAIEAWNENPDFLLAGKMKLDQLGAFGHSRGGAAAVECSIFDERIKAAANLDGAQWGHVIDTLLIKPTAVLSSTNFNPYDVNQYIFRDAKGPLFYDIAVANTGHSNFSDIPYMVRIPQLNQAGSITPAVATASFNTFLQAFFKKHLQGEDSDLKNLVEKDVNLSWKNSSHD